MISFFLSFFPSPFSLLSFPSFLLLLLLLLLSPFRGISRPLKSVFPPMVSIRWSNEEGDHRVKKENGCHASIKQAISRCPGAKRGPRVILRGVLTTPPVRVPRYIAPGSSRLHRITGMISPLFSTRTDDGHAHAPTHILPGHNAGSPYEKRAAVCEFSRNRYIACLDIIPLYRFLRSARITESSIASLRSDRDFSFLFLKNYTRSTRFYRTIYVLHGYVYGYITKWRNKSV